MNYHKHNNDDSPYYDIFDKISKYTDDPEWISVFTDMARGKFKEGYSFSKNYLIFKRGKTPSKLYINDDPSIAINDCQTFMRKHHFATVQEREITEEKIKSKQSLKGWSSVTKPFMQQYYLNNFIDKYSNQKLFSEEKQRKMRTAIFMELLSSNLTSANVEFVDGQIKSIKGIDELISWAFSSQNLSVSETETDN